MCNVSLLCVMSTLLMPDVSGCPGHDICGESPGLGRCWTTGRNHGGLGLSRFGFGVGRIGAWGTGLRLFAVAMPVSLNVGVLRMLACTQRRSGAACAPVIRLNGWVPTAWCQSVAQTNSAAETVVVIPESGEASAAERYSCAHRQTMHFGHESSLAGALFNLIMPASPAPRTSSPSELDMRIRPEVTAA